MSQYFKELITFKSSDPYLDSMEILENISQNETGVTFEINKRNSLEEDKDPISSEDQIKGDKAQKNIIEDQIVIHEQSSSSEDDSEGNEFGI